MNLEQLLGDVPLSTFVEQYYLRLPFSRPGGCRAVADWAGWSLVEALLGQPGVDFLAVGPTGTWPGPGNPSSTQARALLAQGHTLRFRHAERHHPPLAALAAAFAGAFAAAVDVHVYCTPEGRPGLGWHYDAEDVFVLQTAGSKEWSLRKNTVHPWPLPETIPQDMRHQREIMPVLRCDLHAGDWLYIPAGYWHATVAGQESISLAVGVMSATAVDVYDFLRDRLLDSLFWRQRLPTPGTAAAPATPEEDLARYHELFAELGRDLARQLGRDQTIREFLEARRRAFSG